MPGPDFDAFKNRLTKVNKHISKWAKKEGISCYRIYDLDQPDFPIAIDRLGEYLHVSEYKRNHTLDEEGHTIWRSGAKEAMSEVLEVPNENIYFKYRAPQKGKENQYQKFAETEKEIIVEEHGNKFILNLTDYLDTGLFLDHRLLRQRIGKESKGKNVLNLFSYTGSFTIYAAQGGARATTTIDLSNTYLDWAKRNVKLNGIRGEHYFLRADVKEWLKKSPLDDFFDIIVLDPPTFSNSKSMDFVLDIQRDHPYMIFQCMKRLEPNGKLYFSTNFTKFKLDEAISEEFNFEEITSKTIPEDFKGKKIHRCWIITER
jgi:23S rRNA (cytosine1962-C5)-methyltransferase